MFSNNNRLRPLVILVLGLFIALAGAMALVLRSPSTGATSATIAPLTTLVMQAREALRGNASAFDALDRTLSRLPSSTPDEAAARQAPAAARIRASATTISKARQDILGAWESVGEIEQAAQALLRGSSDLESIADPEPVLSAQLARLHAVVRGIAPAARQLVTGPARPSDVANELGQSEIEVSQILLGLQKGDAKLGLRALGGPQAIEALGKVSVARDRLFTRVRDVRALGDRLDLVHQASLQLDAAAAGVVDTGGAGGSSVGPGGRTIQELLIVGLLVICVLLLVAIVAAAWAFLRRPVQQAVAVPETGQAERNQQAILRLLDELSSLADGDLTVQATVTEDITGAIADSINYAVEALRDLVTTINDSAIQLDAAARTAETTAAQLAQASEAQSKQVGSASLAISRMVSSIEEVSGDAERSADVARHSVDVAHKGGEAVRRTIDGMNTIRETIQDTSKRIKRLGESSQEIGNIVELINDIADQTNILALNASIQASMAGEAGRGFAVVADEVQRLAERSTNATRQIEVLVRTIQADTNEAIVSMERSTTDVVGGALLAENAGAALEEIQQVSSQIASLVQNISGSAREQAGAANAVIRIVDVLQQINAQTASGTNATTDSISKLAALATQLRCSVAGFRLPALAGDAPSLARPLDPGSGAGGQSALDQPALRVIGKKSA